MRIIYFGILGLVKIFLAHLIVLLKKKKMLKMNQTYWVSFFSLRI